MLTMLSTGLRFRVAALFSIFAALCFAIPPAALAFGHGESTIACLSHADAVNHDSHQMPQSQMETAHKASPDGVVTQSNDKPSTDGHEMTCCGLFCLSAVVGIGHEIAERAPLSTPRVKTSPPHILVRAPESPERPPNFSASI